MKDAKETKPEAPQPEPPPPSEAPEPLEPTKPVKPAGVEKPKEAEPVKKAEKAAKPPKRPPSLFARVMRWLLLILILVGLGAVLILFTLYVPIREDLGNANRQLQQLSSQSESELQAAQQEIESLSKLDAQNQALQEELSQAQLHVAVLQVRTDALNAQLALVNNDLSKASLALSKTPEALNRLRSLLPADQREFVDALQQRLELALGEIESEDSAAAQSDLNVLIIKLLELEDAVIP